MKKILLIILLCPIFILAQTPGYMGKKLSIGYDGVLGQSGIGSFNMLTFSFIKSAYTTSGKLRPFLAPVMKHGVNLEYVLAKNFAMQAGVQFQRFGLNAFDAVKYDIYTSNLPEVNQSDSFFAATNITYRVGFIFSRGSYIMPQGKYFGLDLQYIQGISDRLANEVVTEKFREGYIGASFDFGNRRIIYDKIVLDASFGFGLNLKVASSIDNLSNGKVLITDYSSFDHVFSMNLFRAKFGIRYLL